jgi:oligopeptide transport system permease protein
MTHAKPVESAPVGLAAPTTAELQALAESPLTAMRPQRSLWTNAFRRLRRNVMAMLALAYLLFMLVVAILAPVIAPHNPIRTDVAKAGTLRQAAWVENANPLKTGDWSYPLGTDAVGRDVFSRLVYGARVSLVVGFIPMVVIMIIGVPMGLIAGFAGGRIDNLLMRLTDVIYAFPSLLLAIIMQISFGDTGFGELLNGLVLLFISLSIVNWTGVARLVRGETLSLKEMEFVEAARTSGAGRARLIIKHILPNSLGPIIVAGAFIVPGAIINEAILSYLGVGVRPDVNLGAPFPTSWGQMILDGSKAYNAQLWMLVAPSIAVAMTTLAFTFIGDGLRDALDPRQAD